MSMARHIVRAVEGAHGAIVGKNDLYAGGNTTWGWLALAFRDAPSTESAGQLNRTDRMIHDIYVCSLVHYVAPV